MFYEGFGHKHWDTDKLNYSYKQIFNMVQHKPLGLLYTTLGVWPSLFIHYFMYSVSSHINEWFTKTTGSRATDQWYHIRCGPLLFQFVHSSKTRPPPPPCFVCVILHSQYSLSMFIRFNAIIMPLLCTSYFLHVKHVWNLTLKWLTFFTPYLLLVNAIVSMLHCVAPVLDMPRATCEENNGCQIKQK